MNVAFVLPSLANKGPVIVARDMVHAMMQYGNVHVVVYYIDDIRELTFNCETVRVTSPLKMDFSGFDIVHTHMLRPDVFVALNRRKYRQTKIVSTIHSYMDKDLTNSYGKLVAFFTRRVWCIMLNRFDRVVCLSEDMMKYYSHYIRPERLTYIYNGRFPIDQEQQPVVESGIIATLKQQYKVIGAIGNLTRIKGFEQLVSVLTMNPAYALIVIGEGPEKAPLQQQAEQLGVSDRCLFLGYKPNAKEYFPYFDIYAVTSHSEGFPLVLLEAASFGKPTVCSDLAVFKEILTPEEVVFYHLYDLDDLSRALDEVIERSTVLSGKIYHKFNAAYTAEIMCQKYIQLYHKLQENNQVPASKI